MGGYVVTSSVPPHLIWLVHKGLLLALDGKKNHKVKLQIKYVPNIKIIYRTFDFEWIILSGICPVGSYGV